MSLPRFLETWEMDENENKPVGVGAELEMLDDILGSRGYPRTGTKKEREERCELAPSFLTEARPNRRKRVQAHLWFRSEGRRSQQEG